MKTLQYINYFRRLLNPPGSEVKAWQIAVWNDKEHLHLSQLWEARLDASEVPLSLTVLQLHHTKKGRAQSKKMNMKQQALLKENIVVVKELCNPRDTT